MGTHRWFDEREFELTSPVALIGRSAARWWRDLASAHAIARPRPSAGRPVREGRRAAG